MYPISFYALTRSNMQPKKKEKQMKFSFFTNPINRSEKLIDDTVG